MLLGDELKWHELEDAGGMNDTVHLTGSGDEPAALLGIVDVGDHGPVPAAGELAQRLVEPRFVAPGRDDSAPHVSNANAGGASDPGGCPGDENRLALE